MNINGICIKTKNHELSWAYSLNNWSALNFCLASSVWPSDRLDELFCFVRALYNGVYTIRVGELFVFVSWTNFYGYSSWFFNFFYEFSKKNYSSYIYFAWIKISSEFVNWLGLRKIFKRVPSRVNHLLLQINDFQIPKHKVNLKNKTWTTVCIEKSTFVKYIGRYSFFESNIRYFKNRFRCYIQDWFFWLLDVFCSDFKHFSALPLFGIFFTFFSSFS